jgi:hypothetical protein
VIRSFQLAVLLACPLFAAAASASDVPQVFVSVGDAVQAGPATGPALSDVVVSADTPSVMFLEARHKKLYWMSASGVRRANLDGGDAELLSIPTATTVLDIAVDPFTDKIYWAESGGDIRRSDLDGANPETLVTGVNLGSAVFDFVEGVMFWIGHETSDLTRAALDGTGPAVVATVSGEAWQLAIDPVAQEIFWSSWDGSNYDIYTSDYEGTSPSEIQSDRAEVPALMQVDSFDGHLFWAGFGSNAIYRSSTAGGAVTTIVADAGAVPAGLALLPVDRDCWLRSFPDGSARVECDDGTSIDIADAAGCSAVDNGNGTATITCGGDQVTISDGADGANGTDGTNGMDGTNGTDGTNGMDGADGADGASCAVTDNNDGTATITCGSDSVTVADGADGADGASGADGADGATGPTGAAGADGADGADGEPCTVAENDDGSATITCPDGTTATVGGGGCASARGGSAISGLALLLLVRRRVRRRGGRGLPGLAGPVGWRCSV